jgi:hypothetical protein
VKSIAFKTGITLSTISRTSYLFREELANVCLKNELPMLKEVEFLRFFGIL